jgi:PTH1 family peptidyl-tRNA hydrolase
MKLIVGLGNIGDKYSLTRHNIGFMVVDKIINDLNPFDISKTIFRGKLYKKGNLLLLKPSTYMNLSGESVLAVASYYKIDIDDIVVIHDDLDLEFGALKVKNGGSHGGHNGLKSIDTLLGREYNRVRVGIGKPKTKSEVVKFVLSNFSIDERKYLDEIISYSIEATMSTRKSSTKEVASKYNRKSLPLDETTQQVSK